MSLNNKIFSLAVIEGFIVMLLEVTSKNYLSPLFGNSLTVWTIIIGNTFLFLSVGYFFGQFLFKNNIENKLKIIFIFILLWILFLDILSYLSFSLFFEKSLYLGAIFCHILLFFPLFTLFGCIPPLLIEQYKIYNNEQSYGYISGKIFFFSSIGGIFSSALLTLSYSFNIEVNKILLLSCILLLFIILKGFKNINIKILIFIIILFIVRIFFTDNLFYLQENNKLIYRKNDLYGDLKVYLQSKDKIYRRLISVNNIPQSNIDNSFLVYSNWNYVHRISMLASLKFEGNALLFGMGGGTIASELQKLKMKVDIVDIDKRMFDVAEKYYFFNKYNSNYLVSDARYYLNKNDKKYDLLVFDVLNGENQPNNLFTIEGINKMKYSLKENGIIIIEFQDMYDNSAKAFPSICNTMLKSGLNVYYSTFGTGLIDYVLVCSKNEIDFSNLNPKYFTYNSKNAGAWIVDFLNQPVKKVNNFFVNSPILTDDLPILDKLCEKPRLIWRRNFLDKNI